MHSMAHAVPFGFVGGYAGGVVRRQPSGGGESPVIGEKSMNQNKRAQSTDAEDDAKTIRKVLDGDTQAFSVLVKRHQDYLFALLRRHLPVSEVAEAAQDSFVKAYEKLHQLRVPESFRAWLSSLALRRAIRYWRDVSGRREVSMDIGGQEDHDWLEAFMSEDSWHRHDELVRKREASSVVTWLLRHVKPEDRIALGLFYAGDHEITEIAVMLGWSVEKVKVRLHRARKLMAKVMQDESRRGGEL